MVHFDTPNRPGNESAPSIVAVFTINVRRWTLDILLAAVVRDRNLYA